MNKLVKTSLVAVIAFTPLVNIAQAAFPDVPEDHIYHDAINYVQSEGIVGGFSDGTYKPENSITRAEFTKVIVNTKFDEEEIESCMARNHLIENKYGEDGEDIVTNVYSNVFPDIDGGEEYLKYNFTSDDGFDLETGPISSEGYTGNVFSPYICVAREHEIIGGYSDGNFYPENTITVGESSKIISNAYGFTDTQSGPEGDIFKPFVDALTERNAIPTSVDSEDTDLKRGEMAQIIYAIEDNKRYIRPVIENPLELNGTKSEYFYNSDGTNRELYSYLMPNSWTKMLDNNELDLDRCGIHRFYDNDDSPKFELTFSIQVPNDPCSRSGKGDYGIASEQLGTVDLLGNDVAIIHSYSEVYSDMIVDQEFSYKGERMIVEVQILSLTDDKNTNTNENIRIIKSLINSIELGEYTYYEQNN